MSKIEDPGGRDAEVLGELVDFERRHVLEIGCGSGRVTRWIATRAESLLGVDPDAESIRLARRGFPERDWPHVSFAQEDVSSLELAPASFDIALFTRSL